MTWTYVATEATASIYASGVTLNAAEAGSPGSSCWRASFNHGGVIDWLRGQQLHWANGLPSTATTLPRLVEATAAVQVLQLEPARWFSL